MKQNYYLYKIAIIDICQKKNQKKNEKRSQKIDTGSKY